MVTVQSKNILLGLCIIEATWLLIAQTIGSSLLLLPCLACFLALILWTAIQGIALPTLLFFLPFAALVKFRPGTISFYTIALLIVYLVYMVKGIKNVNIYHLVPGLALTALTLIVKTLYGETIDLNFMLFFFTILLIPFLKREVGEKYDFHYLTICFTLGIAIAAITAQYLIAFPTIKRYIQVHEYSGLVRYSGYYGDPNFYSAHITAALSGVLVLMINTIQKRRIIGLMILAVLLVYCGSLSVSKSFLLVSIAVLLFWLLAFMFQKGKFSAKITILLTMFVGISFLLASTIFNDQVAMFLSRLSRDNNIDDFTTGRTQIWRQYIDALFGNPKLLFFGRGLSRILVNDVSAHNTLLQCIYQFGLFGCSCLVAWFVCYARTLLSQRPIKKKNLVQIVVLLMGAFGPWMGLDMLRFDEFFLMPTYVCVGIIFLAQQEPTQANRSLES